ncbi:MULTISPECIES: amino acid ABC transporter permease [Microvirga]|uniref:amino acid ABC transporter permease n=1 Tax=Microvirga TaxID=186650 RepID=UPI001B35925B|nr:MULTISPECIES: ABC transporter permease subunit [unclassified Microvirga]MBQ0819398.1 ABC transporter permease subunit [Microvirga sp. HBU67558]
MHRVAPREGRNAPRTALINDPKVRRFLLQALLTALLAFAAYSAVQNAATNLANQRIASGFGFLDQVAGFGISQTLIPWAETMTYGRAYVVGLLNTLFVSAVSIILATILGFAVGIGRLAPNFVISQLARWYVEVVRNLPLLFQILFWYLAVLSAMPSPRSALSILGTVFVSQRGVTLPQPVIQPGAAVVGIAALALIAAGAFAVRWSKARRDQTGTGLSKKASIALSIGALLILGACYVFAGEPVQLEPAKQGRFNLAGGVTMMPEFAAFVIALTVYSAANIGEIVRAGIQGVGKGQTEAGRSLGLKPGTILRLITIPQAMRIIVPMLTSMYLNIVKNSSLGVSIGYPDLVSVGGTILNNTGQGIEVIGMWMVTYLTISIITSLFMNWYNARIALVAR